MTDLLSIVGIEFKKNRHSKITWITFLSFALAPLMGGVFILIVRNPKVMSKVGALQAKASMLGFSDDWNSYFLLLSQSVGVGGILLFGFVSSWIFGREFSDGTSKDLLALPVSRKAIVDAKFITYFIWCFALAVSNMLLALTIGVSLELNGWTEVHAATTIETYFLTALLTILIGIPVGFFALIGRGYMAPLGFVAFTIVLAQIVAATGFGAYFPWSVPGLYSGAAGEYRLQLDWVSYCLLVAVSIIGYISARRWFEVADQTQ